MIYIVALSLFAGFLVSSVVLEVITISRIGWWEFLQLSDFGTLVAQFGINSAWATTNVVLAVLAFVTWMAACAMDN